MSKMSEHTTIKELRKAGRLTQLQLSKLTGINQVRLSFAECGYLQLRKDEKTAIVKTVADAIDKQATFAKTTLIPQATSELISA